MINKAEIRTQLEKYHNVQNLMKYFTVENMIEASQKIKRNKALGIDRISKIEYNCNLEENLKALIKKLKGKEYYPKPIRIIEIPKSNGKKRKLGISCYEDKIVQKIIAETLEEIYDHIFIEGSYGFRKNKNCHQALKGMTNILRNKKVNCIIDLDIKECFDNIDWENIKEILEIVIKDKVFIEYVMRTIKCPVKEKGRILKRNKGLPQGGIASPVLANIYLHYVIDSWFIKESQTKDNYIIRYADDCMMMFGSYKEGTKMYKKIARRFLDYNLQIQKDKTKIIKFNNNISKIKVEYLGFEITKLDKNIKLIIKEENKIKKQNKIKETIEASKDESNQYIINKVNEVLRGYYNYYGIDTNEAWLKEIYLFTLREIYENNLSGPINNAMLREIATPYIKFFLEK